MARLKERWVSLWNRHREAILYILFGGLTTLVNIVAFWLLTRAGVSTVPATAVSWVVSVLFAYVTNRTWVFSSQARGWKPILREIGAFFAARGLSGAMDLGIMALFADTLRFPSMPVKVVSNILVILMNYAASKWFIFKARKEDRAEDQAEG